MKKQLALTASIGLGLMSFDGMAEVRATEMVADDSPYQIQFSTGASKANRSEYYGSVSAFMPLLQRYDRVLFGEIGRQQSFYKGSVSSVDVGLRWLTENAKHLFGVHTGFDYQQSNEFNVYDVVNVGAEWRTARWHVTGNAYLPLTKSRNETNFHQWRLEPDANSAGFHNVYQLAGQEKALAGYEGNVGYQFWQKFNASLYVGGYRYSASDVKTIKGSRVQLQFDVFNAFRDSGKAHFLNRITFESGFQHDNIYKTNWYSGVKFVFNLGKVQRLRGLQPYMQYGVDRTKGTLIRHNDDADLNLFNKADGTPLTIAQVSNQAQLSHAIDNNADVIAVQGAIKDLDTLHLNPDQVLTGGAYTLGNGVTFQPGYAGSLKSKSGHDLIQVSRNNTIENINLYVEGYSAAITNAEGVSVGDLNIDHVNIAMDKDTDTINIRSAINILLKDGSQDSNLSVTNSQFNVSAASYNAGIYAIVEDGSLQTNIANNTMTFATSNNNQGIVLYTQARTGSANILAHEISNNNFTFGDGDANSGVQLLSSRMIDATLKYAADITVSKMYNNQVVMGHGNYNNGYQMQAFSPVTGEKTTLNVNSFIANGASFAGGKNLYGINTDPGLFGNGHLILRNVLNNHFTFLSGGDDHYGFYLKNGTGPSTSVAVYVGGNGVSLSDANHGATVNPEPRGNVEIYS